MHNIHIKLNDNGATVIFHPNSEMPDFNKLGKVTANEPGLQVLPYAPIRRIAFKVLRKAFGRKGKVAAWTRTWKGWGLWTQEGKRIYIARMSTFQKPLETGFLTHEQAVAWEIEYLKRKASCT